MTKNASNIVVLAQLNPICGDINFNKIKALEAINKAIKINANLIIFSELFLLGGVSGDILNRYSFFEKQIDNALNEIKNASKNIKILIGYPEKNKENSFYNSIALIENCEIKKIIRKSIFNNPHEFKTFKQADFNIKDRIFEINNEKYGILISYDTVEEKLAKNVDNLICIDSSYSKATKEYFKNNVIQETAKKYNVRYFYVNQVGANDEFVYDGISRLYGKQGEILARAKAFEEDFILINDFKGEINSYPKGMNEYRLNNFSLDYENDLERTYLALKLAIKDYFSKNGFKKAVLGLSGGLDSTICATIVTDAIGAQNVLGVSMPSKLTSPDSKNDAQELAQKLGINFMEIPIKDLQNVFSDKLNSAFNNISFENRYPQSYTQDNIQARSRAMILWGIANEYASTIPIATSDKSETYMGYATINGDMSGGFSPITDVTKTKLFALARWMNKNRKIKNAIPQSIIEKPPGAELAINPQTGKTLLAEEALMPYEFLDEVIWRIENLNQTVENMLESVFLYEKSNIINLEQKKEWLKKFFTRLNFAPYKWYIAPPGPIIDSCSINKAEFKQPIVSNVNCLQT